MICLTADGPVSAAALPHALILWLVLGYFWLTRSFGFALVLAVLALVG